MACSCPGGGAPRSTRRRGTSTTRGAEGADLPPHGQVPPWPRSPIATRKACRCLPGQRPRLLRELPADDVRMTRASTRSTRFSCRPSRSCYPPWRSRAERSTSACAGWAPRRSIRIRPWRRRSRRSTARCTAGPTSRSADAQGDRVQGQDPAVHQGSEDERRRRAAHGLRPPVYKNFDRGPRSSR